MKKEYQFICRKCGCYHERRSLAVECCLAGDALTPEDLEILGQQRLFDDARPVEAARVPLQTEKDSPQLRLF